MARDQKGFCREVGTVGFLALVPMIFSSSGCGKAQLAAKKEKSERQDRGSQDASQESQPILSPRPLPLPSTPPEALPKSTTSPGGPQASPSSPQGPTISLPTPLPSVPGTAFDIPKLVGQMTWTARFFNNRVGKIFTGYDGVHSFRALLEMGPVGQLPPGIFLNPFQLQALYSSPEYLAISKEKTKNLSLDLDPTLMKTTLIEESAVGRVYELQSLKAGTAIAKGQFENTTLSLAIQIRNYTPEQVLAGKMRYLNPTPSLFPIASCASCHASAAGADHSPYLMAQFSDEGLLSSIETGLNSDDGYRLQVSHKEIFVNPAERAGIVPYLRTLDPKLPPDQQSQALTRLMEMVRE